ncbi:MAG: CHAT domain-containing protein [Caldilineaceae bacterium]
MTINPLTILQRVYNKHTSFAAQPTNTSKSRFDWPKYHFHLVLLPQFSDYSQRSQQSVAMVDRLIAGQLYTMRVTVDPDPDNQTTICGVTMSSDINIYLDCTNPLIHVEPLAITVEAEGVTGKTYEFQVKVAPTYSGESVSFLLNFRRIGTASNPIQLSKYNLPGQAMQTEQPLQLRHIVLDFRLQEQVRILHAAPRGTSHYHIRSYWDEEPFDVEILNPGVSPARYIEIKDPPKDIIDKIKAKSSNNPVTFIRWLKDHLYRYGQNFCLVIQDDSDESDMAWELIHLYLHPGDCPLLPADLCGQVPLGALITITRWVSDLHWYDIEHQLTINESMTSGRVVAFFDHGRTFPAAQTERNALKAFVTDDYGDINSFRARLDTNLNDAGLIYIGSHGIIINEKQEKDFILSLDRREEIKVFDLTALSYLENFSARPIVIVNACHSAWLFRHEGVRYGLSIALLQQIAKDFVGTIGPVSDKRAAEVAEAIFAKLNTPANGMRLAELLRDIRTDAFRKLTKSQSHMDDWLDFLYTFMYVYYGNPFSRLQLTLVADTKKEE